MLTGTVSWFVAEASANVLAILLTYQYPLMSLFLSDKDCTFIMEMLQLYEALLLRLLIQTS